MSRGEAWHPIHNSQKCRSFRLFPITAGWLRESIRRDLTSSTMFWMRRILPRRASSDRTEHQPLGVHLHRLSTSSQRGHALVATIAQWCREGERTISGSNGFPASDHAPKSAVGPIAVPGAPWIMSTIDLVSSQNVRPMTVEIAYWEPQFR